MKYLILIAMLFVAGLLFLPSGAGTGIRNVPILIAILVVLFGLFVWSVLRSAVLKRRVRRALRRAGFVITKRHKSFLRNRLFAEYAGTTYQILLLNKKRARVRYHFDGTDAIQFYKTTAPMYKTNRVVGQYVVGRAETSGAGKKRLRWLRQDAGVTGKRILLFDKMPGRITDSKNARDLGVGDPVCGSDVHVYDLPAFVTYLGTFQTADGSAAT